MNSGEIARLAGVSVRTLRHYHQINILPEPVRRTNGYRSYDIRDLVLLLRIRRLAELGVALDDIPALLDAPEHADRVLDDLDRELAGQINRLTARRAVIARLRATGASPDIPPELAEMALLSGPDLPPDLARLDREMMTLLHHGLDDDGRAALTELVGRVVDPELLPVMTELAMRFAGLGPGTTEAEIDRLIADFHSALGHLGDERFTESGDGVGTLLDAYQKSVFNDAQQLFFSRMTAGPGETARP
ncbi:MAG TPA: MerR family transcriptional regulator [Actinoplanes sp.]|nr:MerR family transcriptional regulator [Actinoplanes sp.]